MRIERQQAGLAVFVCGIILTAIMLGIGITGQELPDWLLMIAAVL